MTHESPSWFNVDSDPVELSQHATEPTLTEAEYALVQRADAPDLESPEVEELASAGGRAVARSLLQNYATTGEALTLLASRFPDLAERAAVHQNASVEMMDTSILALHGESSLGAYLEHKSATPQEWDRFMAEFYSVQATRARVTAGEVWLRVHERESW